MKKNAMTLNRIIYDYLGNLHREIQKKMKENKLNVKKEKMEEK
jgi:hypothetical protein